MAKLKRRVYVIQRPPRLDHFDTHALSELGKVEYLLPAAPDVHDPERGDMDFAHMVEVIKNAGPDDVFVALGGSPISNHKFGEALQASGVDSINYALYSRDINNDGARLDSGRYRIVTLHVSKFPEAEDA